MDAAAGVGHRSVTPAGLESVASAGSEPLTTAATLAATDVLAAVGHRSVTPAVPESVTSGGTVPHATAADLASTDALTVVEHRSITPAGSESAPSTGSVPHAIAVNFSLPGGVRWPLDKPPGMQFGRAGAFPVDVGSPFGLASRSLEARTGRSCFHTSWVHHDLQVWRCRSGAFSPQSSTPRGSTLAYRLGDAALVHSFRSTADCRSSDFTGPMV